MKTNAMRYLEAHEIAYVYKPHARAVFTSEEAAIERGVSLSQIVKTMLVMTPAGVVAAVMLPGDRKLDLRRVAAALGEKKVAFLPRDQVLSITGYEPGAVSPLTLRGVQRILCDSALLDEELVDISSGRPDAGMELRSSDLVALINPIVTTVSRDPV